MTKMDYNRPNGGHRPMMKHLEVSAKPISKVQRKAWATIKRNLRQQHQQANQDPEIRHAQHPSRVVEIKSGKWYVWCDKCRCSVTKLTDEQAKIWRELNPPKIQRAVKSTKTIV